MSRFAGKTIIITGAASGIGKAAALRFSAEGANVVALDVNGTALEQAVAGLDPDRTLVRVGDTSKAADTQAAVDAAVERFGGVDVLINNAGIWAGGDVTQTEEADWDRMMAINVKGYFLMAKAAMPELRKRRGNIVQTSSVSGTGADWGAAAYDTAKGAITNMTRAMALDHGKDGVRVNAVNPTFTVTGMVGDASQMDFVLAKFMERIPMKRVGQPEDIAAAMTFLASDDAGFITGVNLPVDGGVSASNGQPQF